MNGDVVISSMPVKDLVGGMNDVAGDILQESQRDFRIVII